MNALLEKDLKAASHAECWCHAATLSFDDVLIARCAGQRPSAAHALLMQKGHIDVCFKNG